MFNIKKKKFTSERERFVSELIDDLEIDDLSSIYEKKKSIIKQINEGQLF